MDKFILPVRVYYEDSDAGGVVYYANYLKFMERARTEWLRNKGFEQTVLKQQYNLVIAVRKISVDYLKPAFFDDLLTITVQLSKIGKASIIMAQQVQREAEIICKADVKLASINAVTLRPQAFPSDVFNILN
jgi:acyl-CoA thioester hydrolase